ASAQYLFNRGELERGAADLARALVRTPMSAQTHELAGKILVEIAGTAEARQHYETARGLDPGRSQVIDNDVARIDALEGKWAEAERRAANLLASSDPSIAQLGWVNRARQTLWRANRDQLLETWRTFTSHIPTGLSPLFSFVSAFDKHGAIDRDTWQRLLTAPLAPGQPRRSVLMRYQIMCELALAFDAHELAIAAIERLNELGFLDITWLDMCPLM